MGGSAESADYRGPGHSLNAEFVSRKFAGRRGFFQLPALMIALGVNSGQPLRVMYAYYLIPSRGFIVTGFARGSALPLAHSLCGVYILVASDNLDIVFSDMRGSSYDCKKISELSLE